MITKPIIQSKKACSTSSPNTVEDGIQKGRVTLLRGDAVLVATLKFLKIA